MTPKALLLVCAFAVLATCSFQTCDQGDSACQAGNATQASSMLQRTHVRQAFAASEDDPEKEGARTASETEEDLRELKTVDSKLQARHASSGKCKECRMGCAAHGSCYKGDPRGDKVAEGLCKKAGGTWCGGKPVSCESCKDGCIYRGSCHTKTPWGATPTERVCKALKGKWCGAKATCETACRGGNGCLIYGKCYYRAREGTCNRFRGEWCS